MPSPAGRGFTAEEVAREVGGRLRGEGALALTGVATLEAAGHADLSFLHRPEYRPRQSLSHGPTSSGSVVKPSVPRSSVAEAMNVSALDIASSLPQVSHHSPAFGEKAVSIKPLFKRNG